MKISSQELSRCIAKVHEVDHAYKLRTLNSSESKRSIDVLLEVCVDSCGKPIEVCKVDSDVNTPWLYGTCLQFPQKAVILYAHHLNSCWERFTVCKEAFHVVLDQDEYRTTDIYQHIQDIILAFPDDDSKPAQPVICEFLAEVAAMEFMLPYAERFAILEAGGQVAMQVAQQYKIPCQLVEKYLSAGFMAALNPN